MTRLDQLLLACVFVQALLTFGLMIRVGQERARLTPMERAGEGDALSRQSWPDKPRRLASALDSQFQLPVLFYVAVVLTLWSGAANGLLVALAVVFVACRLAHVAIHITFNPPGPRFFAYAASFFVLFAYWLVLAFVILAAPGAA